MNKKAMNSIVPIILIVLLSLLAVSIVWYFVENLFSEPEFKMEIEECKNVLQFFYPADVERFENQTGCIINSTFIDRKIELTFYCPAYFYDEDNEKMVFGNYSYTMKTEFEKEICESVEIKNDEYQLGWSKMCYDLCEYNGINISSKECLSDYRENYFACGRRETFDSAKKRVYWLDGNCECISYAFDCWNCNKNIDIEVWKKIKENCDEDDKTYICEEYLKGNYKCSKYRCGEYIVEVLE